MVRTVYEMPDKIPLYGGGLPPLTLLISWSCVLMYSIGHVQHASIAPAIPPLASESPVSFFLAGAIDPRQGRRSFAMDGNSISGFQRAIKFYSGKPETAAVIQTHVRSHRGASPWH